MAKNQYTYAVARIRSMEVSLFSQADIEQLLACRDEKQCLQLLQEKGWGNADTPSDAEAILTCEREKTWAEVGGMIDDMSVFDVLSYPDLFHNLKAAIKMVASGTEIPGIFHQRDENSCQRDTGQCKKQRIRKAARLHGGGCQRSI